ncbi:hypothetical protein GCM10011348_12430 [Marinobacterium nitratireducens]|uniref:Uncharacterized protein n=1 Tax=Marinobacterium nitratireducens TaxID=518897 RepID=A0A917Z9U4_9GAMM|nr:hypothetical protein GCM10011348_12430 [Marinobacterium nitratireducens]
MTIDVDGAGAALGQAATELGAGQLDVVANGPQQRCIGRHIDRVIDTVHLECDGHGGLLNKDGGNAQGRVAIVLGWSRGAGSVSRIVPRACLKLRRHALQLEAEAVPVP